MLGRSDRKHISARPEMIFSGVRPRRDAERVSGNRQRFEAHCCSRPARTRLTPLLTCLFEALGRRLTAPTILKILCRLTGRGVPRRPCQVTVDGPSQPRGEELRCSTTAINTDTPVNIRPHHYLAMLERHSLTVGATNIYRAERRRSRDAPTVPVSTGDVHHHFEAAMGFTGGCPSDHWAMACVRSKATVRALEAARLDIPAKMRIDRLRCPRVRFSQPTRSVDAERRRVPSPGDCIVLAISPLVFSSGTRRALPAAHGRHCKHRCRRSGN